MKKTLLALSVAAFAANSASALTIVDSQETGTKVDFTGSLRLMWRSISDRSTTANHVVTRDHVNHAISNNGSRFGFKITQDLAEGFYALGRVEWRSRGADTLGVSSSQHNFDHIYVRQLYAGIGHKQLGELTYGNQTTITDEVKQTDLPNTLSLSEGLLDYAARRSVQYVYNGVEGLRIGGYYAGSSKRNDANRDLAQKRDNEYGAGATYRWQLADNQSVKFGAGFTRENYKANAALPEFNRVAYAFGTAYTFGATTLGLDLERRNTEDQYVIGNERVEKEVRTVLFHRLTDQWNAYGMYAHKRNKLNAVNGVTSESRKNQFMIGTEHAIAKETLAQYKLRAKAFLEWQTTRTKHYTNGVQTGNKSRNNTTVAGFRVYW